MKLQTKATLVFVLGAAGILAVTDAVFVYNLYAHMRHLSRLTHDAMADNWAAECAAALRSKDLVGLERKMETYTDHGQVVYAFLAGPDGRFILHTDRSLKGRPLGEWRPADPSFRRAELRRGVPAPGGGEAQAGLGDFPPAWHRTLIRRAGREVLPPVLAANAAIIAVILGVSFLFTRWVIRPVRRLSEAAREVGKGRLDTRVAVGSGDELGALQKEFNAMVRRLSEIEQLKTDFLAKITHDLRGPLGAISGTVEIVHDGLHGPVNAKQKRSLTIALQNVEVLAGLINNMLDVTKMEAGRMEYSFEPVDLKEAVESAVRLQQPKAEGFKVRLRAEAAGGLPAVRADRQALGRVLANLVSNALKCTPEGGSVSVRAAEEGGGARVSVADTGIGIPPEKLERVFSKFTAIHAPGELPQRSVGTGLGLTICKEIVEAHGGRIGVESRVSKGTTFHFTLPAAPPSA